MSRVIFGLSVLASLIQLVSADGLFFGCYADLPAGGTGYSGIQPNSEQCYLSCDENAYSYYAPDGSCYCATDAPAPNAMRNGIQGSCDVDAYEGYITKTTYDSTTCYTFSGLQQDGRGLYQTDSPKSCLATCATFQKALLSYQVFSEPRYYCGCANEVSGTTTDDCGQSNLYVFNHPADASASGIARRHALEAAARFKRGANSVCPGSMTACLVLGLESLDAWECIDTQNDLESCGGCLHGTYKNASSTVGESCSKRGVKLGASTCVSGECQISECKDGFELLNNECIYSI